jgi:hypothetical protein
MCLWCAKYTNGADAHAAGDSLRLCLIALAELEWMDGGTRPHPTCMSGCMPFCLVTIS